MQKTRDSGTKVQPLLAEKQQCDCRRTSAGRGVWGGAGGGEAGWALLLHHSRELGQEPWGQTSLPWLVSHGALSSSCDEKRAGGQCWAGRQLRDAVELLCPSPVLRLCYFAATIWLLVQHHLCLPGRRKGKGQGEEVMPVPAPLFEGPFQETCPQPLLLNWSACFTWPPLAAGSLGKGHTAAPSQGGVVGRERAGP